MTFKKGCFKKERKENLFKDTISSSFREGEREAERERKKEKKWAHELIDWLSELMGWDGRN